MKEIVYLLGECTKNNSEFKHALLNMPWSMSDAVITQ